MAARRRDRPPRGVARRALVRVSGGGRRGFSRAARHVPAGGVAVRVSAERRRPAASVGRKARLGRPRRPHPAPTGRGVLGLALLGRAGAPLRRLVPEPRGAVPTNLDRLRHAGPRARRLGPDRRHLAFQGRGVARGSRQRGPLHRSAARRDTRPRTGGRRDAREGRTMVGRRLDVVPSRSRLARAFLPARVGERTDSRARRLSRHIARWTEAQAVRCPTPRRTPAPCLARLEGKSRCPTEVGHRGPTNVRAALRSAWAPPPAVSRPRAAARS